MNLDLQPVDRRGRNLTTFYWRTISRKESTTTIVAALLSDPRFCFPCGWKRPVPGATGLGESNERDA